jgi:hypothetical protein
MTSQTDRSLPELFGDAMAQLAKLVGNEFALARAELSEKASQAGRAARTNTQQERAHLPSVGQDGITGQGAKSNPS